MPISEDEYDYGQVQEAQTTMSKAELRKTHKPIMEKRRRARINQCLNEIKTLILEAMKKDPSRHSKLEKADILEMAVKHLQNVERQQLAVAMASDPSVLRKFKNGFNECATEINKYVNQIDGVDHALRQRINQHLSKCMKGIEQIAHINFPSFANLSFLSGSGLFREGESSTSTGDQNNNPRIQLLQGLQLIPSRLPTGEFALLLPNSSNLPFIPQLTPHEPPLHHPRSSAFVSVVPSTHRCPSPSLSPEGFKPMHRSAFTTTAFNKQELQQVPQVTSTSLEKPAEIKTVRFPITKCEKIAEPLCIITNHSERYKQAQTKEDAINCLENIPFGVKRKIPEQTLLTTAHTGEGPVVPIPKRPRVFHHSPILPSTFHQVPVVEETIARKSGQEVVRNAELSESGVPSRSGAGPSNNVPENNDMWRPW